MPPGLAELFSLSAQTSGRTLQIYPYQFQKPDFLCNTMFFHPELPVLTLLPSFRSGRSRNIHIPECFPDQIFHLFIVLFFLFSDFQHLHRFHLRTYCKINAATSMINSTARTPVSTENAFSGIFFVSLTNSGCSTYRKIIPPIPKRILGFSAIRP